MKTLAGMLLLLFAINSGIPKLNKKMVEYIDKVIGRQVDRGECWDLAAAALDYSGAYLDRTDEKNIYKFGKAINPLKEDVFPGDIIQFENVTLQYETSNAVYTENMPHHTAIVYKVMGPGHFQIAHQNTSFSGRKVGLSELNLSDVNKGKLIFYRPVASR